jgi:hypothetical protein
VNYWNEGKEANGSGQRDAEDSDEEEEEEEEKEGRAYIESIEQLHAVSIATLIERGEYIKPYRTS